MNNSNLIIPKKLQGFWELMPKEQMLFSSILNTIEDVFKQNCFLPLDTPVLEYSETLLAKSGGETDKEVYRFTKGSTDMCMRYDLTVPLARFVSMHQNELEFPFKRYQIGKVYRGERPQKGRFREFYQCDADIIGNQQLSLVADAECISLFEKCFNALGLDVDIEVSNRKLIAGFIEDINKLDKSTELLIVLDKLEKISVDDSMQMLKELGLSSIESEKIINLTKTSGNIAEIEKKLKNFCQNSVFLEGLNELIETATYLDSMGAKNIKYNLSIIRGHNYYTGTVFEAFLKNEKRIALGGGGRFDNLCSFFSNTKMPGVGMSIGVTRLFDILLNEGVLKLDDISEIECAVVPFDETLNDGIKVMTAFRQHGIKADCMYENKSFKSKLKEANRRNIKYVVIVGENEVETKNYTLKNMQTAQQECLPIEKIIDIIIENRKH